MADEQKIIVEMVEQETSSLDNKFFKKAHSLVFSSVDLSPVEYDIFALFLSRLAQDDWREYIDETYDEKKKEKVYEVKRTPVYTIPNDILSDWFNVEVTDLHKKLKKASKRLNDKTIGIIDDKNKEFMFSKLFPNVGYQGGSIVIEPNRLLLFHYFCLSQGHSQVPKDDFINLNTEYAKRLFTILCRFKKPDQKLHAIFLNDLYAYLGLIDSETKELKKKAYARTDNVISKIIKPAIAEIKRVAGDKIEFIQNGDREGYATILESRRIVAIEFLFKWKQKQPTLLSPKPSDTLERAIIVCSKLEAQTDLDTITNEDIEALKSEFFNLSMDSAGFDLNEIMEKLKILLASRA